LRFERPDFGSPACKSREEGQENPVDTQTRHALKKDSFAEAAASSMSWLSGHSSGVLRWLISGVVVVLLGVAALIFWNVRTAAADTALGAALDVYNAPLAVPGAPAEAGVYTAASDRAKEANRQFVAIAGNFGLFPAGSKAHYFAGVTYEELGQTGSAESELKTAAGSMDRNVANLAKLALAGLYHQTARDSQAIEIYNALAAKPSDTVSAAVAQLDLADLYAANGKQDQARAIWAKVKDSDKEGAAGSIAAQKLAAKQ
jgi:predicted negative regulator of RcsB-dependent stress response